jgi:hypothetical protein
MCERSKTQDAFPRYPRLPVLACPGYEERTVGSEPPRGPR